MSTIDERLQALEREVSGMKRLLEQGAPLKDWRSTFGMSRNNPEFEEIVRLGREIRQNEREIEDE